MADKLESEMISRLQTAIQELKRGISLMDGSRSW
jgi:hypothetical protein